MMTARGVGSAALSVLLFAASASAGLRAKYGGRARLAVSALPTEPSPWLLDTPAESTLAALRAQPLCRLESDGRLIPVLAESMARTSNRTLRIVLRPVQKRDGTALDADDVLAAWSRLWASTSPYRALLAPFAAGTKDFSKWKIDAVTLELPAAVAGADAETGLCHPALAVVEVANGFGVSTWTATSGVEAFTGNAAFPEGQPYLSALELKVADARSSERLLEQKKAVLTLGGVSKASTPVPTPFATYLLFNRSKAGAGFRAAAEASVDRAQLASIFAQAPAVPTEALLPQLAVAPLSAAKPAPLVPTKPLTLLYDASREDQRAVAERLQVKLKPLGYALALKGLRRAELTSTWAQRDYDVMLFSVLPTPAVLPALGLVLELAGAQATHSKALASLPSPTDAAYEKALSELERKWRGELDLIPLFAQGLPMAAAAELQGFSFDGFGRLRLENLFLSAEPP